MELDFAGKGDDKRRQDRPHLSGAPLGERSSAGSVRLLTAVSIAALCGLSALLVVPGYDMYELYRYGVTDSEYCGGGGNTILFGYDLGCDVDWRQIFVVGGIVWTLGRLSFPIVVAVSFILRFLQTRP